MFFTVFIATINTKSLYKVENKVIRNELIKNNTLEDKSKNLDTMNICKHCGKEIENNLDFCFNCGKVFDDSKTKRSKSGRKYSLKNASILGFILFFIAGVLLVYLGVEVHEYSEPARITMVIVGIIIFIVQFCILSKVKWGPQIYACSFCSAFECIKNN